MLYLLNNKEKKIQGYQFFCCKLYLISHRKATKRKSKDLCPEKRILWNSNKAGTDARKCRISIAPIMLNIISTNIHCGYQIFFWCKKFQSFHLCMKPTIEFVNLLVCNHMLRRSEGEQSWEKAVTNFGTNKSGQASSVVTHDAFCSGQFDHRKRIC